jgi:hypothetical protein
MQYLVRLTDRALRDMEFIYEFVQASVLLNGKWHFIDKTGHFVLDPPFVQVRSLHNGLAFFLDGQSPSSASDAGYIDKTGRAVWPRRQ